MVNFVVTRIYSSLSVFSCCNETTFEDIEYQTRLLKKLTHVTCKLLSLKRPKNYSSSCSADLLAPTARAA